MHWSERVGITVSHPGNLQESLQRWPLPPLAAVCGDRAQAYAPAEEAVKPFTGGKTMGQRTCLTQDCLCKEGFYMCFVLHYTLK